MHPLHRYPRQIPQILAPLENHMILRFADVQSVEGKHYVVCFVVDGLDGLDGLHRSP